MTVVPIRIGPSEPMLLYPTVSVPTKGHTCYGVDVSKRGCVAARRNEHTPAKHRQRKNDVFEFENDAAGFEHLLSDIRKHGGPESCSILFEPTGHYSATLRQFLQQHRIEIFVIQPRSYGKNKTDKRDARALADIAYNQLVLGALPADEREHIHSRLPPTPIAKEVHGLIFRLCQRERRRTQLLNKLTAISDQLFPEMTKIYKCTHSPSALALREQFPSPADIAGAKMDDLLATRLHYKPGRLQMVELQELARQTVGLTDPIVVDRLLFEQKQIIEELRLLEKQVKEIEARLHPKLDESREAQILMSFCGVAHTQAAILLACIGNFDNFEMAADLCGLAGWRPFSKQTGTTVDSECLRKVGNMLLKKTMCLIVYNAIQHDPTWKALYERLVKRKCQYDERKKEWRGKMKVIGRIAGQILRVMFTLIKRDQALIASLPPGSKLPEPELYSPSKHRIRLA